MAVIASAHLSITGASNPNQLIVNVTVEIAYNDFEKQLFSKIGDLTPFRVEPFVRSVDLTYVPGDRAPMSVSLGTKDVMFNHGANSSLSFSKTFNRGGDLNEDPFPFPANTDEINAAIHLFNTFSNTEISSSWSNTVSGNF